MGWHGWAMVFLPTKEGGIWVPVDLTYFQNAIMRNGHIQSTDPLGHIQGSALLYSDTAIYLDLKTRDYVNESIRIKNNITNSDSFWIEEHTMSQFSDVSDSDYSNRNFTIYSGIVIMTLLAIIIFITLLKKCY